jgi:archaeal cell division control protein 6
MTIDDMLMYDETIFRDIRVFNLDYVPERFLHRELQMEALKLCLRPAIKGGRPSNAIVVGSCATGKTTAIKKVFEEVEKYSDKILCVYINCQLHTTRFNIFSQIYQRIFGHLPPETGIPFSRIYEKIMKHLKNNDQALVVALDDVNYLFHSKNANKIFYDILRAYEEFEGVRTGLFAVVSDIEFRYILDKNVNSVFIPKEVIFNPYSYTEVNEILRARIKAGFYPDVISDEILEDITENTVLIGDLRAGIQLLGSVGNIAESEASKAIQKKHLDTALRNTSSISLKNTLQNLSKSEKTLLELIMGLEAEDLIAGNLYKMLNDLKPLSYASFDRLLNKLEFLRIIDIKFTGKGSKGNARVIILRFDQEEIGKCMG